MSTQKRILVVDDEPQIQRFLRPSLVASDFSVTAAATAAEAARAASRERFDLVILDLGLPDRDGKELIPVLRAAMSGAIIVLSARDREAEKIAALDLGADDYVDKPFAIGELLARIRSHLRRGQRGENSPLPPVFTVGPLNIDVGRHSVTRDGTPVRLTPKEFDLLVSIARHAGRVLTHRQLLADVWGPAHVGDTQYLRVFIGQLRQKLETDPAEPRLILTEPGVGYRFSAEGT